MKKKSIKILIIVLFQLLLISCKNAQQKANDFVTSYNNSAQFYTNNVVTATSAKLIENNNIEIRFETNLEYSPDNQALYSQFVPNLMSGIFTKDETTKDLIEEGITFFIGIYADNNREIASVEVDKKKLDEFLKAKKPTADLSSSSSSLSPQLKEMLAIMNQSLPIENKEEGTKITKIDINGTNELVYSVEVGEDYAELLKSEEAKGIMKESILRSPDFRTLVQGMRNYGISKVKYIYLDSSGKKITDLNLTSADLR
ncbi:hypothetical protein [Flavobacterium sp.]|uniref:hypothetical protein n=1 Tax=Flavobacterium sp. TaxID=239 RepID=UPI002B4B83DF|nr:hypothetical protein [Flavobacterium sp.]HLP64807.1 hypothetical protein [Flavobacterium sp.]